MCISQLALLPLIAILATGSAQSPSAQDWRYVTTSTDGMVFYYSTKSAYGDIRDIWIKNVRGSAKEVTITLKTYRCDSGAERLLRIITYNGDEILNESSYDNKEWSYSYQDTVGGALLNAACGKRRREWTYIGSANDKEAFFMKMGSLSRIKSTVRVWTKSAKNEETTRLALSEYDCIAGRYRNLQTTTYNTTGSSSTSSRPSPWTYAVPDSVGESYLRVACQAGRNLAQRKPSIKR